jgi:hypothetical protein
VKNMANEINKQEDLTKWVREQFQRANKHLAESGILFDTVVVEESRYMAPHVAVWKIKDRKKNFYWVLAGDLPADAVPFSVADNARAALKHFSMSWQLKAENIMSNPQSDTTQKDYAALLVNKADMLYQVQENDEWWQGG